MPCAVLTRPWPSVLVYRAEKSRQAKRAFPFRRQPAAGLHKSEFFASAAGGPPRTAVLRGRRSYADSARGTCPSGLPSVACGRDGRETAVRYIKKDESVYKNTALFSESGEIKQSRSILVPEESGSGHCRIYLTEFLHPVHAASAVLIRGNNQYAIPYFFRGRENGSSTRSMHP